MNFLLAPNAMKGALSALRIAQIMERELSGFKNQTTLLYPIADGGNGTLDCLISALGGTIIETEVSGIISSEKISSRYGILPDNTTAIIESAEAIGLHKISPFLSPSPETIAHASSRGLGELMNHAIGRGCTKLIIGLGGSATNDGGAGMARVLGFELLDSNGEEIKDGALNLVRLAKYNPTLPSPTRGGLRMGQITILADVKNILLGEHGATYTFAKQKGASEEQLPLLESALKNFADVVEEKIGKEFRNIPGSGAAGGLGFGLMALCNAEIVSGIDFILDAIRFDEKLHTCDCVITSEGQLDEQTLFGKGIFGIVQRAKKYNKPVHAFVGRIQGDTEKLQHQLGLASLIEISPKHTPTEQAMNNAEELLIHAVKIFAAKLIEKK
mgnify:CR=1 FL=1